MQLFFEGDQVSVEGRYEGVVIEYDEDDNTYRIERVDEDGDVYRNWIAASSLTLVCNDPQLSERDYQALIDLALETKDEAWFTELTERRKGAKV